MKLEKKFFITILAAMACFSVLFWAFPSLDIAFSNVFYDASKGGFWLKEFQWAKSFRTLFMTIPAIIVAIMTLLFVMRLVLKRPAPKPRLRMMLFLWATLILGPGLLVNVILKDNSARPRPVHITKFGGELEFKPLGDFSGKCETNCSFVSGETASATWVLGLAFFAPSPMTIATIVFSSIYIFAASLLRIAFGGHFISDVIISFGLTLVLISVFARIFKIQTIDARDDPWEKWVAKLNKTILNLRNSLKR